MDQNCPDADENGEKQLKIVLFPDIHSIPFKAFTADQRRGKDDTKQGRQCKDVSNPNYMYSKTMVIHIMFWLR